MSSCFCGRRMTSSLSFTFPKNLPQLELLRLETWQSTPMQSKPLTLRTLHCLGFVSKSRSTKSDLELFQNYFLVNGGDSGHEGTESI